MRVLDLFCGEKGIARVFEQRGHEVISVDIDPSFNATITSDILQLHPRHLVGPWDFIWASLPCETYSVASIGHHWTGGRGAYIPKTLDAENSMRIGPHTRYLIESLRPTLGWMIENPRGVLRKMWFMQHLDRKTVSYCQYGQTNMKPTDLWGGFPKSLKLKPMCKNGDPCHERAPRGAKTGTQGIKGAAARAVIPYQLAMAVCLACETDLERGSRG